MPVPSMYLNDDDERFATKSKKRAQQSQSKRYLKGKRSDHVVLDEIVEYGRPGEVDEQEVFQPTLTASRHERDWILHYLGEFFEEEKITDVLRRVKGGKEANVYCCTAGAEIGFDLLAAKLYRPRMFRNLRNDSRYRQGRRILDEYGKEVHDDRYLKAVRQGTRTGKELQHMSWIEHEFQTMEKLYAAGVPIPKPVARGYNTILMQYVGELDQPAPALNEVSLKPEEARRVFNRLIAAIEGMLGAGRIHADLSAYNVLYWEGEIYIIDFPQAVDPQENPEAYDIFRRDVLRVCQYFRRHVPGLDPAALAEKMWRQHQPEYRALTETDLLIDSGADGA